MGCRCLILYEYQEELFAAETQGVETPRALSVCFPNLTVYSQQRKTVDLTACCFLLLHFWFICSNKQSSSARLSVRTRKVNSKQRSISHRAIRGWNLPNDRGHKLRNMSFYRKIAVFINPSPVFSYILVCEWVILTKMFLESVKLITSTMT